MRQSILILAVAGISSIGMATAVNKQSNPTVGGATLIGTGSSRLPGAPLWPITQEGTAKPVVWVDAANARFSINDGGSTHTELDDLVLDKETGLIWERSPTNGSWNWAEACREGYNHDVLYMKRKGWRLPDVEELTTLVRSYTDPSLPDGHPFLNVLSDSYWTATTQYSYYPVTITNSRNNYAFVVHFNNGAVGWAEKNATNPIWLVRGGRGNDGM